MDQEKAIFVDVERRRQMKPYEALVVYREESQYAMECGREVIHFEITSGGSFVKPKALSLRHLQDIFNSPGQTGCLEYLDRRILALNNTAIVWFEPSRETEIFFDAPEKGRKDLNKLCKGRLVRWPALLFKLSDGRLFCRALNSNRRPTPETRLFVTPLTHIAPETGAVCLPPGLKFDPAISLIANMRNISENFYNGVFGHATGGALTAHPGGHDGLWREILQAPQKRFPTQYLKETAQTLQDFLR